MGTPAKSYSELIGTVESADKTLSVDIPDNWRQGRTTYGGLTAGLCYLAAVTGCADLPPLRSMQITFVGPVSANPRFKTTVLRRGKNVVTIEVKAYCEKDCVATSCFLFGQKRESSISLDDENPHAKAPEDCDDYIPRAAKSFLPAFIHNFDMQLESGNRPATGATEANIRAWARQVDAKSQSSLDGFLTLADILPPAASVLLRKQGQMSSMNWQVNFTKDNIDTTDGWFLIESQAQTTQDGYSSQFMRYWNRDGDLIAEGTQTVAIFG